MTLQPAGIGKVPALPDKMQAVELRAYDGRPESLVLVEKPVPIPGPGQVLVRMAASPINPSDLLFIRGHYGFKKQLPVVPGFEGSGWVVAGGGGFLGRLLQGRRVACAAGSPELRDGTWAEYVVTSSRLVIPLRRGVDMERAAMMLVNPLSAWALMEIGRRGGHRALVQTAAASALGQMIIRLGLRFGLTIINVVRREEQREKLKSLGAVPEHILVSTSPDFDKQLKETCRSAGATLGFDAVAGDMTARLVRAMPSGSRVLVYGSLSLEPCQIDPGSFIFERKQVAGFWLPDWLRKRSLLGQLRLTSQVQDLLSSELASEVQARFPIAKYSEALARYGANMSAGKVLLVSGS
jgi:NADPH:quinone reductase-like Zn-dependent oxidoreductase